MMLISPFLLSLSLIPITLWILFLQYYKKALSFKKVPKITELPIVTATGQIVNSVEELDMHLEFLQNQLEEKETELEVAKAKISSTQDNLKTINDTANEVKKYYFKLKSEITKNEKDYEDLKVQIEEYKMRQLRLREEVSQNVKYYADMLSNIDSKTGMSSQDDYEVIGKIPVKSGSQILTQNFYLKP